MMVVVGGWWFGLGGQVLGFNMMMMLMGVCFSFLLGCQRSLL